MMNYYPSQYIDAVALICERFAPTAFHATLPNGKETVAFVQRREAALLEVIRPGDRVHVVLSPADFDRARIVGMADGDVQP